MIRGYIFDLDGTLLDTLDSLANSFNRTLASFDYPTHPVDAYRHIIGDGLRAAVERCLPVSKLSETEIAKFTEAQQADYLRTWQDDAAPYPGIIELLSNLEASESRLAVLSNKNHPFTVRCVEHFLPDTRFDVVLGHSDEIPHKPDPTGALRIANQLELAPYEIAFIGDTWTDMSTAVASGMLPIGALWGFRDYEELKKAGARHIISEPLEVIDVTRPTAAGEFS